MGRLRLEQISTNAITIVFVSLDDSGGLYGDTQRPVNEAGNMPNTLRQHAKTTLIINADDFGYFRSVSMGILDAGKEGAVTATGIMANSHCLDEYVPQLKSAESLDTGVHLNLTYGSPLSHDMDKYVERSNGAFPGKSKMAIGILSGRIRLSDVVQELRAQIERCLASDIVLRFLNSHEHIHMLPPVFPQVIQLAKYYGIPSVRYTDAEWIGGRSFASLARNCILSVLGTLNRPRRLGNTPKLIGMNCSGKLNFGYLAKRFASLRPGCTYELMCHPGYFNPDEINDQSLLNYHNWEAELTLLRSTRMAQLCDEYNVRLTGYRNIVE